MKAIVVTDQAAGTAGMTLVERPEPPAAISRRSTVGAVELESPIVVTIHPDVPLDGLQDKLTHHINDTGWRRPPLIGDRHLTTNSLRGLCMTTARNEAGKRYFYKMVPRPSGR
jgi:hypothetical protein